MGCIIYNNESGSLLPGLGETVSIGTVGISQADGQKAGDGGGETDFLLSRLDRLPRYGHQREAFVFQRLGPHPGPSAEAGNGSAWRQHFLCQAWRRLPADERYLHGISSYGRCSSGGAAVFAGKSWALQNPAKCDDLTDALLMSTAHPALREDGSPYSPRQQGAGVLNLKDAVMAEAYLTVDGCDRPKVQLGRAGKAATPLPSGFIIWDRPPCPIPQTSSPPQRAWWRIRDIASWIWFPPRLQEGTDYTVTYEGLTQGNQLTVPAGGEAVCTVTLALTQSWKTQIFGGFPQWKLRGGLCEPGSGGRGCDPGGCPTWASTQTGEQAPLFDDA